MTPTKPTGQDAAKKVEERSFQPGKLLFSAGEPGGDLFFIDDGEVEIFTVKAG